MPGLDMMIVRVCVLPISTFPKNRFAGVTVSNPVVDVVVAPVPFNVRVVVGFDALDVNETVAVALPITCGLNVIARGALLPGSILMGNCVEEMVNNPLSVAAAEIINLPPFSGPVLLSCAVCVDVVPVCTEPKFKGDGVAVKNGAAPVFEIPKSAFTVCEPLIVTVQVVAPLHAPDHAFRAEPLAGVAESTTDVPWLKLAAHVPGHVMPAGLLVTLPLAPPLLVIVTSKGCTGTKLAVTD